MCDRPIPMGLSKIKDVSAKIFNTIARLNEAKVFIKHILCDFKCKATMNFSASVKSIRGKKSYSWNPITYCANRRYLKGIVDSSVNELL